MKTTKGIHTAGSGQNRINPAMQLKMMGKLLLIEACFMIVPMLVCLWKRESDWKPFLLTILLTAFCGGIMSSAIKPKRDCMGRKDGCMFTCSAWIFFSLFGMLPFIFGSPHLNVSEGFFEAISGFTTTGATVIRNIEACSHGIMIWRALTQWIGGLGIVLFSLAVLPSLNNSKGLFMFHAEVTGITHDKIGARIANTAKILWTIYTGLTILLVALLWAGPMDLFESVCHAFGAISTGGFSTRNESIAAFTGPYTKIVLTVFMFIGGVNFSLVYAALRGDVKAMWKNDVFRAFVTLIFLNYAILLLSIIHSGNAKGWQSVTVDPLFHIVSGMTSTGFGAGNFEAWGELSLIATFFMMYFGACAGSTAGGAKIDRLLYLMKNCMIEIKRGISPRSMKAVRINGQIVSPEKGHEVGAFIVLYTALVIFGGVVLSAFDVPIVDSFFSAISCVSNNGLGAGVTGITGSYDFLPALGKWVMSFLMLAGRLEVVAIIVLFSPSFWKK